MGRIRTIKPELFRHDGLYELEKETGLPIRIAFAGLFCCCDREGRFEWKPKTLKLDILPWDDCDFSRVLDALLTRGFVRKYTSEGRDYGYIPTWTKHQTINNREKESDLPNPQECHDISDASGTRAPRVTEDATGKGRDGKGKGREEEGEGRAADAPDDASPEGGQEPREPKPEPPRVVARRVLAFLNERAGRAYEETDVNLDLIVARLKEGYDETRCRQVIARKLREWKDDDRMRPYLRPATLFNREKFNQYAGECVIPQETRHELS